MREPATPADASDATLRVAVVQPVAHVGDEEIRNLENALAYIDAAAAQGADVVAFPETYPGPWRMPLGFDPTPEIAAAARRHGLYVQYGTLEPIDVEAGSAYNVLMLAGPSEDPPGRYRRTHPPGPWIYSAGAPWSFGYVAGDEFPVFPTAHGVVGLAMCSEVYVPEVARALALRGAELFFLPAGTDKRNLRTTWRHLIWARAIENLAVVVTTQNVFSPRERGLAMVAGPEAILFETTAAGMFMVDVDLSRSRALRAGTDGPGSGSDEATKPGLLSQWQRPELYDHLRPRRGDDPLGSSM